MGKFSKYLNNGKPFKSTSLWGMAREHEESKKKGRGKGKAIHLLFITNNSPKTVYFKPEKTMTVNGKKYYNDEAYPLAPGEKWYRPIDGIATCYYRYMVYKVLDNVAVTVHNNCTISELYHENSLTNNYLSRWIIEDEWIDSPPDSSWDKLFEKAKTITDGSWNLY